MTADLTKAVQMCEIRQQIKPALPKEPMKTYSVPLLPGKLLLVAVSSVKPALSSRC